jgi:hypothetical protein
MKSFFRRPATIVAEILALIAACILGAVLPQVGRSTPAAVAELRSHGPLLTALVDSLALDHIFTSLGFLALLACATISLSIVVVEQVRRLRAQWQLVPTEGAFRRAPYRLEFLRPARGETHTRIRMRGRLGLAGSPLFHVGLLFVILAGSLSALFGVGAVVDLYEGEVLPATVEAWGAQWPGPLGKPFCLDDPLRLVSVEGSRYPNGELKGLRLKVALLGTTGERVVEMGINDELSVSRGRLYAESLHGPAALLEWHQPTAAPLHMAVLLERKETQAYGAYAQGPGALRARVRAPFSAEGQRPGMVEVRILEGSVTVAEGTLKPGDTLPLPGGGFLKLHHLPAWARLHGKHDPALALACLGFILALLGAALTYGVTRVDELVSVAPEGMDERVVVALRPHRFVPLFQERFEALVREHGGEV